MRFNTCTSPTEKLFDGHTDVLFLRSKGESSWHGVADNTCELTCANVMQPHTVIHKVGSGDNRCNDVWSNPVDRVYEESCTTLGLTPCPKWGLHTGTQVAIKYRKTYPQSRIVLLGFTFHTEEMGNPFYGHDGFHERLLIDKFNITIVEHLE